MLTIKARRKHRVSVGYGPNNEIADIVSGHANFNSYTVLFLLLLHLLEGSAHFSIFLLHGLGGLFTLGRFFHFKAFSSEKMNFSQRVLGMHLTIWPLLAVTILCLAASVL